MHENLEAPLKSRIPLLLLTLILAASSTLTAQARDCSNRTLKGTWANSIHGQLFLRDGSTLLIDGIVKTTYDGEGNFTQVDAVADNGNITPGWRPGSGTYTVNPDCTGTSTIVVPGMPRPAFAVHCLPVGEHVTLRSSGSGIRNCGRLCSHFSR